MILSHYIDVKSIQVISGFNFQKMNRITRWRCSTNISKTYPKIMISPLLAHPQGCQGWQKNWKTKLKTTLVSWSTEIQLKLNRIQKTFRKQVFFDSFCSMYFDKFSQLFTVFFFQFWLNLSAPTHQSGLQFGSPDFWQPLHAWGRYNSGVKQILVTPLWSQNLVRPS